LYWVAFLPPCLTIARSQEEMVSIAQSPSILPDYREELPEENLGGMNDEDLDACIKAAVADLKRSTALTQQLHRRLGRLLNMAKVRAGKMTFKALYVQEIGRLVLDRLQKSPRFPLVRAVSGRSRRRCLSH
jgi:hypothetical protein